MAQVSGGEGPVLLPSGFPTCHFGDCHKSSASPQATNSLRSMATQWTGAILATRLDVNRRI